MVREAFYTKYVKNVIDRVLGILGLICLSWLYAIIAIAIVIDDPGPVLFKQKRVGKKENGEITYFDILKFRSMKMSTPHDVPTHMLDNPEQYITRVGKVLRKTSLDELPQIWNITIPHNLSIIGPRPALWNQNDLVAEREKYGANDVMPGLTGWAQINGRDELEIEDKARLDGEYVQNMSFAFDVKCFFGTIFSVLRSDGVVEGGTGEIKKHTSNVTIPEGTLVSVVMATYKRDDTLSRALKSLVTQTYKNFEVVLVDDNDNAEWTAKVQSIVVELNGKLNINYIINEHNMGSAATRNRGIAEAKGQYITFLDDDDIYLPEKIEMQLKGILSSDADYGITDLYLYNENDVLIDKRVRSFIKGTDKNSLMRYHLLQHLTGTDTFMFKTNYLRVIGGFPRIDVGDEFYLMREAILVGGKFNYEPHCYVKAYVHSGESKGLSTGEGKINGENALYEEKKKYYEYLSEKDIQYVEMRHYAVIAFAEMRRKNMIAFVKNAAKAVLLSPIACIKMFMEHM